MNIEEIDKWLDNEYGCSYTRLEELHDFLIDRNMKYQDELERYKNIINKAINFIESMEYCGQEDYFYDEQTLDPCGNDNTFEQSKTKLLDILNKTNKE